ncbi:hypothetical protein KAR91_30490, partial [Candidatus Pacearchaeota archaeon]|nr:hypothetical protein [Candidatus Pacearchaeota archaeon]
ELIGLDHNIAQIKTHNTMELQIKRGLPVQIIIVKARQEGVSTEIEAMAFERVNRRPNTHACVVSADKVSTAKVFRMCELFQQEMPIDLMRPTDRTNAQEIRYKKPWRSTITCQTAGAKILGRGGTTQIAHCSEVAFWSNAKKQLLGFLQEVPETPETMIVYESTANGDSGAFYDTYWQAVDRLRSNSQDYAGFLPISLPWQTFPEYQQELPKEWKGELRINPDVQDYFLERLAAGLSFSPEQMYFAALKIQNKCGGDIELFKQEYPSTAREAFQSSGRQVFKTVILDKMERLCRKPIATIEFYMDGKDVRYRNVNRRSNCWSVWYWPVKNHEYIEFGDVAEGIPSDSTDEKSDLDRSVAAIFNRTMHDVPATYYGRPDTIEFGDQMLMAAKFYNYAWASPEMNSIGMSVLDTFKRDDYQYIYQRETKEETVQREDSPLLGWKTTVLTRKPMIADLQQVIIEEDIKIYDIRFIEELRVFIWNSQGKPEAKTGEHDDCVITLGGLTQLHQRCPIDENFAWAEGDKKSKAGTPSAYMDENDDD